jgi:hypothetical protein
VVWASITTVVRSAPESLPVCRNPIIAAREMAPAATAVAAIVSNRRSNVRERIRIGYIVSYMVPTTLPKRSGGLS